MTQYILYFLALLNPFALFIYLLPLKKELGLRPFLGVLVRASLITYVIYAIFAVFGNRLFTDVLQVDFESFRIFGGIVLVAFALSFIVQGKRSMITTRGELSLIAAEVSMPFMVGAATIALATLMGQILGVAESLIALVLVLIGNGIIVSVLAIFRQSLRKRMQEVLDKNLEIVLRINGFIVGTFGIDLIITGISNLIH